MRSVIVFPATERARAIAVLDELAQQTEPYHVDGCLHVSLMDDTDELPIFLAWEEDEIAAVARVVGDRPTWCVMMHLSWREDARDAARRLALALLVEGGAATDDYSTHPWTAAQLSADELVGGRLFCRLPAQ